MTQRTRILRNAAIVGVSTALLGITAPVTAVANPSSPLTWGSCEGTTVDPRQQCATLQVPMDHSDPGSPLIDIAVSRIPAEDPDARRGALLLIAGGPGGSSLNDPSGKGQKLPQGVRDTHDLIGFAPRGLAPSTPVSCGLEHGDLATSKLRPWPAPDGSVDGNMATARRMADACARNGGELIKHLSTADEARDIDRLRAALGERKISAWGVSYGTYVGAVYSQLFPHRTDRIVLDSVDNPDPERVNRAWLAGHEQGVEDTFPHFAAWASKPGNPDRLARRAADVRPMFLRLAARLDREPIPWPGANPEELNGNVLRQALLDGLYRPSRYPALAELIRAARQGTVPPAPQARPRTCCRTSRASAPGRCATTWRGPSPRRCTRRASPRAAPHTRSPPACPATRCSAPPGRTRRVRRRYGSPTTARPTSCWCRTSGTSPPRSPAR